MLVHSWIIVSKQKGYRCLASGRKIIVSCYVDFNQSVPFANSEMTTSKKVYNPQIIVPNIPFLSQEYYNHENNNLKTVHGHYDTRFVGSLHNSLSTEKFTSIYRQSIRNQTDHSIETNQDQPPCNFEDQHIDSFNESSSTQRAITQDRSSQQIHNKHHMMTKQKCGIFKPKTHTGVCEIKNFTNAFQCIEWL